jgi:hypothetical protein
LNGELGIDLIDRRTTLSFDGDSSNADGGVFVRLDPQSAPAESHSGVV